MMDLVRERALMTTRKGSDVDMNTWEKVGESLDVVNGPSVILSKPCTEIIIFGEGFEATQAGQILIEINNVLYHAISGINTNLSASYKTYYLAKLRVCGFGIDAEVRGDQYPLSTFSQLFTAIFRFNVAEITSIKLKPNFSTNAFTSGKFEIWGR